MQKSPFPGMDPFIEGYEWPPFHHGFISSVVRYLVPQLPQGYLLAPEKGITAQDFISSERAELRPDIGIQTATPGQEVGQHSHADTLSPPTLSTTVERPSYHRIHIRLANGGKLVTVIELLSLANKRGIGLTKYRRKRDMLISDEINLVEIDLLRARTAPAVAAEWPRSAYRVQVINPELGITDFWAIGLDESLPTIGIPLLPTDRAVPLDLQAVFEDTYYFGMYASALDYDLNKLQPRASDEERAVIDHICSKDAG